MSGSSLPAVVEEIVRAIGHGPAMALVRALGGQEIHLPRGAGCASWELLVEVIGEAATRRLVHALGGGQTIYVALCHQAIKAERNRQMIARYEVLLGEGLSGRRAVALLVREFAPISYRQVETIVNSPLPAPSGMVQAALF